MLTDTHCHLETCLDATGRIRAEVMERAEQAGVGRMLAMSQDLASMRVALALGRLYPTRIRVGLGLHPMLVPAMSEAEVDEALAFLEAHIDEAHVVGEVGIDFKFARTEEQKARQKSVLLRQLALAAKAKRPINLHSRGLRPGELDAARLTLEIAAEFHARTGLGAQLHWYTHSRELAIAACESGLFVSIGPSVLEPGGAREVARAVPRDHLLLETDAPVRFGRLGAAEPAWVRNVASVVATELWHCPLEEVERQTEANFAACYG